MTGKNKCKILKSIRREIAKQNDIDLVIEECKFKGNCIGTCPKCEAEVRYLEDELNKRRQQGKRVAVAGIAAGLAAVTIGCTPIDKTFTNSTDGIFPAPQTQNAHTGKEVLMGDIAPPESETVILQGKFYPEDTEARDLGVVAIPETSPEENEEDGDDNPQIPETIVTETLMGDPVEPR